jgi:phospholipase C
MKTNQGKSPAPLIAIILFIIGAAASCHKPGIPRFDHVVIVVEENHGYDEVVGSANAPFINSLAMTGALFTNSHGIGHPSQPNYLVLYSGSTQGVTDDHCLENETPYNTSNLGASLIAGGHSFRGYAQTMPSAGFMGCTYLASDLTVGKLYARKHTPWVNWLGTETNNIPASFSLPMTAFPNDYSKLPTVAFVVPDMDYDMHNIGLPGDAAAIRRGDKWLKQNIAAYAEWAKTHNSLLIVTFDEDDYKPNKQNRIPTIFYGANIINGKYGQAINHYNVLHTLQAMYQLPAIDTVSADAITNVWKSK